MSKDEPREDADIANSDGDHPAERPDESVAHSPSPGAAESEESRERRPRQVRIMGTPGVAGAPEPEPPPPGGDGPALESAPKQVKPHRSHADLRSEELLRGTHPGDRYIRYDRHVGAFRRKGGGVLAASLATEEPRSRFGRAFNRVKRVVIGAPISTEHSIHERLTKVKALAVLSSDALSSVAYATEEILRVLILAGMGVLSSYAMPVGFGVMALLAIVAISYRQTIAAYPRGGGSYIVAKDNLGTLAGLTAAASILIDYTMTVAVSTSAGIDAINSLYPQFAPYKVEICLVVIVLITLANLRGVREAGNIFAVPTYLFLAGILFMIALGMSRFLFGIGGPLVYVPPPPPDATLTPGAQALGVFLLLRAFAQGCTALTGVEAISDGVPAFKPPESPNARRTLVWMAVLAITMFGGITFLSAAIGIMPSDKETVLSQLARNVFSLGPAWFGQVMLFYIDIATALILILAANTAFSDFPRLSYFLARDKFMPHQYSFRGDRLAFSWGIVTLATLAAVLIIAFGGNVTALIPLYTVGVFNSFTLSQTGMVVRWWRLKSPGWQRSMTINAMGATATFVVLLISIATKFLLGAWIVVVLIPIIILGFLAIHRHYTRFATEVVPVIPTRPEDFKHTVIVPVARLDPVSRSALAYARSISPNVNAVHIAEGEDPEEAERFNAAWRRELSDSDVPLVIIESPYRSLVGPLLSYIDALDQQSPDDTITIVLPELLPSHPWEYLLHGQSALRLKAALLFRPNTVVVSVPYVTQILRTTPQQAARGVFSQFPWAPVLVSAVTLLLAYYFLIVRH